MLRSVYTAVSGIAGGLARQQVAVNNLANVDTVGFKRQVVATFPALVALSAGQEPDIALVGLRKAALHPASIGSGVYAEEVVTDFSPGALKATDEPLDLALAGEGFFRVETPDGERYTRDGRFSRDAQGKLVALNGHPVLGEAGVMTLGQGPVQIAEDGTIISGGEAVGRLNIATFETPATLVKCGENLFSAPGGAAQVLPPEKVEVKQGYLEMSNVDLVEAVVDMLTVARIYQTNQQMLQTQDELLSRAINDLGRIS